MERGQKNKKEERWKEEKEGERTERRQGNKPGTRNKTWVKKSPCPQGAHSLLGREIWTKLLKIQHEKAWDTGANQVSWALQAAPEKEHGTHLRSRLGAGADDCWAQVAGGWGSPAWLTGLPSAAPGAHKTHLASSWDACVLCTDTLRISVLTCPKSQKSTKGHPVTRQALDSLPVTREGELAALVFILMSLLKWEGLPLPRASPMIAAMLGKYIQVYQIWALINVVLWKVFKNIKLIWRCPEC